MASTLFLDSNIIIKYYLMEPGSDWVRSMVDAESNTCVICSISIVEVASALAQLRRNRLVGNQLMRRTFANFREHMRQGLFLTHPVDARTIEAAAELALRYPLKGFDATQVAAAVLAAATLGAQVTFVSGDKQALSAARGEGLPTDTPYDHTSEH